MAFKFRSKSSLPISKQNNSEPENDGNNVTPKLTNAQLNKLTKVYPSWLKDNSGLKQLPGIYQGVLGQVQLQPGISIESQLANGQRLANRHQQMDYMNRFTDTERVHQLLSASRLSNETLATIWAHVNKTFPGKLTNREVCLALALIAIFQRLEKKNNIGDQVEKTDPFSVVRSEKKPPIPTLYPGQRDVRCQITQSKSIPDELSSSALLVDIREDSEMTKRDQTKGITNSNSISLINVGGDRFKIGFNNSISLIDMDGGRFEMSFFRLTQIWLKFLSSMKAIFKRSFDILNVENSRQSATEALRSSHGKQFSKQLCLCYPLAHNIRYKIDQLNSMQSFGSMVERNGNNEQNCGLFDKKYIKQIDDLMTSINEYWAVLINLFHESGQTKFIELIMDGLNYKTQTVASRTIDELASELNGLDKADVCSICHTKFYLVTTSDVNTLIAVDGLSVEDAESVSGNELISDDSQYYYHAKCANFWLNQVDQSGLPFQKQPDADGILSPATK